MSPLVIVCVRLSLESFGFSVYEGVIMGSLVLVCVRLCHCESFGFSVCEAVSL